MSTTLNGSGKILRKSISLLLAICLTVTLLPAALASNAGTAPSSVTDSNPRSFVQLSKSITIFKSATPGDTGLVDIASGTVLILVSENTYTGTLSDSTTAEYGCLYYNNERYNVLWNDVKDDIMTSTEVETYVTGTLWATSNYSSLKKEYNLTGNVQVYGLQLALKALGLYTSSLDGGYGDGTASAVRAFQRKYKLEVDGYAGPFTQKVLYPLALAAYTTGTIATGSSSSTTAGTLVTKVSINLRKSASTKTARLAVVPKKTTLAYTNTTTVSGVTWYYVTYNSLSGWLMSTYVTADGSSGSGSSSTTSIGTVTITMANTRVRTSANGSKSGYVLSKGSTVDLLATPTTVGGYTWYYIRTASGYKGYVRGDCATANLDSSSPTASTTKSYIRLTSDLTVYSTETPNSGSAQTVASGTVLQMYSTDTYTVDGVIYCSVYYNNTKYNCLYASVKDDILTSAELITYITGTLWPKGYITTLKAALNLVGDVNVHGLQYALTLLGYYTGTLDGNFGSGTTSAVRNFQRQNSLTVDGSAGPETYPVIISKALALLNGGGGSSGTNTDFGTVTSVVKANWDFDNAGIDLFPKGSTATVMDITTGKVFKIYRWSGAYHADCVPYTAADTKIMCDIVNFAYSSSHPSSTQLSKIKGDVNNNNATYTWPDFKGTLTSASSVGSAWDRRPALLNVNGTVYPVSIYGWPHGFDGSNAFSKSKFSDGTYFYERTNYYGMMCVHFTGSYTHVGKTVDTGHQASIATAYSYAKAKWPTLVK